MKNRTAALLANMAATASLMDGLIAKAKGIDPKKPEPKAPPVKLEDGSRTYLVADWMPTCSKCGRSGCDTTPRECGSASWFPIFHRVDLVIRGGVVVSSSCHEGRKAGGGPCAKEPCRHVDRVKNAWGGIPDKGVELSIVSGVQVGMPKCPSCRERWSVSVKGDGFECRNPVCVRDGQRWQFKVGDTAKPPPMRDELVINEREPGRVIHKRQTTKKWGAL